jgi:hypothetical protein
MEPYETVIMRDLPGDTPKAKYEKYLKMKEILQITAYPRFGTFENVYDIAKLIQDNFNLTFFINND